MKELPVLNHPVLNDKESLLLKNLTAAKLAFSCIPVSICIAFCSASTDHVLQPADAKEQASSDRLNPIGQGNSGPALAGTGRKKAVTLTDNEKQIARKLGFDEFVLLLIKETLNPEMGIVMSGGLESQDMRFLEANLNEPVQLLQKDVQNYETLKSKYPQLKPVIDFETRHFDNRDHSEFDDAYEKEQRAKLGNEKFERQKKYYAAVKPYQALIAQEMQPEMEALQNQHKGLRIVRHQDTSAFIASDEALAAAIADLHKKYAGKVLKEVNRAKSQLAIKYFGVGDFFYGNDRRMPALRSELEKLNYRISDQNSHFEIRKQFESKAEAQKFLEDSGTLVDSISLSVQAPKQFKAIYPVDFEKDFVNIDTATSVIKQTMGTTEVSPELAQLLKILMTATPQVRQKTLSHILALRILPGSKVTSEGNRHWLIEVPERFTATVRLRTATVFKLPAQGSGYELVETQGTNGANYGLRTNDVINKLKYWDSKYGITVVEANHDSVKIRFKNLPDDISELCTECFLFCPDIDLSPNEHESAARLRQLAAKIKATHQMSFWWD